MKKILLVFLLIFPWLLWAQTDGETKKILMVVSSYGKDQGQTRPGFEFDEFSQAYLIFQSNQLQVAVASPRGGKVEADKFNADKPYNKMALADPQVMALLEQTKPTASIDASAYDAIYIVGGKGAMFDLPYDPSLQDIVLELYKKEGGVISSVCHGPAALVNVKDGDEYIVKDVEITSFCNDEEALFGKKWVKEFPFQLEDQLTARGAVFQQTEFMLSKVAVTDKFVTGQNPFSTPRSAEAVVRALGMEPVSRVPYPDEQSVYLIQEILDGQTSTAAASSQLSENTQAYDIPLIAAYGYYTILHAKEDRTGLMTGIGLVELTADHFYNENLQFVLAKTYLSMDEKAKAKAILEELKTKGLLPEQVTALLKEIG